MVDVNTTANAPKTITRRMHSSAVMYNDSIVVCGGSSTNKCEMLMLSVDNEPMGEWMAIASIPAKEMPSVIGGCLLTVNQVVSYHFRAMVT